MADVVVAGHGALAADAVSGTLMIEGQVMKVVDASAAVVRALYLSQCPLTVILPREEGPRAALLRLVAADREALQRHRFVSPEAE
jgi:hypothetical protein